MTEPAAEFSIVSYNIRAGRDFHGNASLDRQVELLRSLKPDLLALQEVDRNWDRSGRVDQCAAFASRLNMNSLYAPNLVGPWQSGRIRPQYGVAVLWAGAAAPAGGNALSGVPNREPRGFAWVEINRGGGMVRFVSTHLGLDEDERTSQTELLCKWVEARPGPVVVAGDFNMTNESREYELITSNLADLTRDRGLLTFPSGRPDRQLDYIFASPGIDALSVDVVQGLDSDHLPLVARLGI